MARCKQLTPFVSKSHSAGKKKRMTPLRHRKVLRNRLDGISKADIRRLARRGGVVRISNSAYQEVREVLRTFLHRIMHTAIIYAEYGRRKTVTVHDVIHSLKREGRTLFGCELKPSRKVVRPIFSHSKKKPALVQNVEMNPTTPQQVQETEVDVESEPRTAIQYSQVQETEVDVESQPKTTTTLRERIVSRKALSFKDM